LFEGIQSEGQKQPEKQILGRFLRKIRILYLTKLCFSVIEHHSFQKFSLRNKPALVGKVYSIEQSLEKVP